MKRNTKKPDAILTADWHLREDTPVCRIDDFEKTLWRKVRFIADLQKTYDVNVYHAGDLFHHWKPSPRLLSLCIRYLPKKFYTVYGNHDLPQHSMQLKEKSGVNTLAEAKIIEIIAGAGNWNEIPRPIIHGNKKIGLWHKLVYAGKTPFPGIDESALANKVLRKHKEFDLLITGDNHKSFICRDGNRLLVNPGCITRQRVGDQDDPCVYLWYADTNTVKEVFLPVDYKAVDNDHLKRKEEREERIDAFITKLNTDNMLSINFVENLRIFEASNSINSNVMQIVYNSLD